MSKVYSAIKDLEEFVYSKKADAIRGFKSIYNYTPDNVIFDGYTKGKSFENGDKRFFELTITFKEVTRHDDPYFVYLTYNIEK